MGVTVYETIDSFNKEFRMETLHPLVHIAEMGKSPKVQVEGSHCFNFYSVYLKDSPCGKIMYGRNYYDYQDGTLLFLAPMQVVKVEDPTDGTEEGWVLMFHSDLLRGTQLGQNLKRYTYFQYDVNEALHLSRQERETVLGCFRNIAAELRHAIDSNSKDLIVSNLELFLNYCKRFYERQFITRSQVNTDMLSRFERILDNYFRSGLLQKQGFPTVRYCAEAMNMSVNYLSDLLRKDTGMSAIEHIQQHLVEVAKEKLSTSEKSVSEIAYELGFEYPQYFSRLFKKKTGVSPNEYRSAN